MNVAVFDLGTNTFHALIAEVSQGKVVRHLHREKVFVKIGKGGISQGRLTDKAMQTALDTMLNYQKLIGRFEVEKSLAVATSAFRNASNGGLLADQITQQTQIPVRIISGEEEANLIYTGINSAVGFDSTPVLIMDVGGGSTEFILCNGNNVFWKQSFEIGAQRLYDAFHRVDPMPATSLAELHDYLNNTLSPLWIKCKELKPRYLVGSAGTFETLRDLHDGALFPDHDNPQRFEVLPTTFIIEMAQKLAGKTLSEREAIPGMHPLRADTMVVASSLVSIVVQSCNFEQVKITGASLKEGALAMIAEGLW